MAVETTGTSANFVGTGVSSVYTPGFYINTSDQVVVTVNGVVKTLGVDYVVNNVGASAGCNIVATFALGAAIYVERVTPITQLVDTQNNETILEDVLDAEFDKLTMIAQELGGKADRALLVPKGEAGYTLPAAATRASKFLAFGVDGSPVMSSGTGADAGLRTDLASSLLGTLLIAWKAAGAGAVLRTLYARLLDLPMNVKDFGAKGDSTTGVNGTDDTAAFNLALATNKKIMVPAGLYRIAGNLTVTQNGGPGSPPYGGGLYGDGIGVTTLACSAAGTALSLVAAWNFHVEDMTIKTSGVYRAIAGQKGIVVTGAAARCVFRGLEILGFDGGGLHLTGTVGTQHSGHVVQDIFLQANGGNQFYSLYANDFTYKNLDVGYYPGITKADVGIMLENSGEGELSDTKTWSNVVGTKMLNCIGNRLISIHADQSDHENLWIEGGSDNLVEGARLHTPSQAGNGLYDNVYMKNTIRIQFIGNMVQTWNATFGRWGVNFDTGCDYITLRGNSCRGFDTVNFGPYRFDGGISRVDGDLLLHFTGTSVAAASTSYLSTGNQTLEGAAYKSVNRQLALLRFSVGSSAAPGAGKNFVYTMRKNGGDTSMTSTTSGAASFGSGSNTLAPQVLFDQGDFFSPKLVTDAASAVTDHRGYAVFANY